MRVISVFFTALIFGILFAVLFGVVFDQFSVRNSPAYFTIGHPSTPRWLIDPYPDLTRLGLYWGIVATWWMGAALGLIHGLFLVLFDRKVSRSGLLLRHVYLVCFMGLLVLAAWQFGPDLAGAAGLRAQELIPAAMLTQLEDWQIAPFFQNALMHYVAYGGAGLAAIFLLGYAFAHGRFARRP